MSNSIKQTKLNIKTLGHFKNNYDSLFFYKNAFMYQFLVNQKINKLITVTDFINKSSITFNTKLIFNNELDSSEFKFYISDKPIINVESEIEKDLIIKKKESSNIDLFFSNTEFFIFNNSIEIDYSKNMSNFIKNENFNNIKSTESDVFFDFQKSNYENNQENLSDTLGFFINSLSYYDLEFILSYYFINKKQNLENSNLTINDSIDILMSAEKNRPSDIKKAIQDKIQELKNKKIFTIKFFSLFDNTDNTYIKRKFFTETKLSIIQDNISFNESRSRVKDSIKLIDQNKINNLTYSYDLPGDQKNTLEKNFSNLNIIDSIQDIDEVININLKYFLIKKVYIDEENKEDDKDLVKIKKQQYDEFIKEHIDKIYFYDPEIYFINVNNKPYKLKDKNISGVFTTENKSIKDNDFLSQYFVEKTITYSIKTSDIIDMSNISSNYRLINLNNFYKKSFIYFDSNTIYNDLNISAPEFNSNFKLSKIPTFIPDSTYNLYEDINEENRPFLPLPKANSIDRGRERFSGVFRPTTSKKIFMSPLNTSKFVSEESFKQIKSAGKKDVEEEEILKVYGKDQNKDKAIQEITKYKQKNNKQIKNNISKSNINIFIPKSPSKSTFQTGKYRVYKRDPSVKKKHPESEVTRAKPWKDIVKSAAKTYNLPEALIWAHMQYESDFVNGESSGKGAQGLMQLMPSVAKQYNISDRMDPKQNIFGAAKLINTHKKKFKGNLVQMISAYHAGGGATRTAITNYKKQNPGIDTSNVIVPYEKTNKYVNTVLNNYYYYLDNPLFENPINNNNQNTLKETKIETQQIKENSNNKEDEIKNKKSKLKSSNLRKNNPLSKEEIEELRNQSKIIRSSSPLPDSSLLKSENKNQGDSNESIFSYDNQGAPLPSLN